VWKKGLLPFLTILIWSSLPVSGAVTLASVSVTPHALAQITDFSVTPAFTGQDEYIDFSVTVENTGNLPLNATPALYIIDSSNNTLANVTLTPARIEVGNNVTFFTGWYTGRLPMGKYRAVALVHYDGGPSFPAETRFEIQREVSGSDRPIPPVEIPLGDTRLRFTRFPVIEEMRPGETGTSDILFTNVGDANIPQMEVEIEGIPEEWVDVRAGDTELEAGDHSGINMILSVPPGAYPGNYRVTTVLKGEESEARTFFILRVKPYPAELDRPVITRRVVVDTQREVSTVTLKVENAGRFVRRAEVVEDIPKAVASSINQVDFNVPPSEIIEYDPVVRWAMEDIDFFETRIITYEVSRGLEEYTSYVNWPLKQFNIFYDIILPKKEIVISNIETTTFSPGQAGSILVTVANTEKVPINVTMTLGRPSGWKADPEGLELNFFPLEEKVLNITLVPPKDAVLGVYTITLKMDYVGKTTTKDLSVFVREPPLKLDWVWKVLYVALLILLIYIGRRVYKRRKKVYREDVISTVHRLEEEMIKGR
jgi:hypothetical protein